MVVERIRFGKKGQFITLVALAFVVLGLMIGLAIDAGRAYLLRANLSKFADALAVAAATEILNSFDAAKKRACDAAAMNGMDCAIFSFEEVTVTNPDGSTQPGIRVTATDSMNTSFMRLGALIGCGVACEEVIVSASAIGTKGGFFDLVLNMDDTQSMEGERLDNAKIGATALVDAIIPPGGSSASNKAGMVPFRGCYDVDPDSSEGTENCIDSGDFPGNGDIVPLTDVNSDLVNGIDALTGAGDSGTNVCEGLRMARQRLFESGTARPDAEKFIVILTDAENNPKDDIPVSPDCDADKDKALDSQTYDMATNIKNGTDLGSSGQAAGQQVTIFVIYYGEKSKDPDRPPCNPGRIGDKDDDRNLAICIASSPADYYPAPNPEDIREAFIDIISRLPLRLAA